MADDAQKLDMTAWVCEKMENVLSSLAMMADVLRDPETPNWYKRNLGEPLKGALHDALKVATWANGKMEAWYYGIADKPSKLGTIGLIEELDKAGIHHRIQLPPEHDPAEDEDDDRATATYSPSLESAQSAWPLQRYLIEHALQRLSFLGIGSQKIEDARVFAYIAWRVMRSEYADVARLDRKFMASDVKLSQEEFTDAIARLREQQLVAPEPSLDDERSVAYRLIVPGVNDPRGEPPKH